MSSGRPVYVPSRKRRTTIKRQPPFLHGAFTGGFSAGYYNTVGSKEGWQPMEEESNRQQQQQQQQQQQRVEDFMDEQDHNEWGGPVDVRRDYDPQQQRPQPQTKSSSSSGQQPQADHLMMELVMPPSHSVGQRLLRVLGWREESSTAYVPQDNDDNDRPPTTQTTVLSQTRLRKIRLQRQQQASPFQNNSNIPPPKHDTCGLGYERFHRAPEFQRDLERRRRLARQRARAVTNSNGGNDDNDHVYRLSNLFDEREEQKDAASSSKLQTQQTQTEEREDDHTETFETLQDFVGSKGVGGFALREDDDDVYDDEHPISSSKKPNLDEYDTVLHDDEHHHSDVEEEGRTSSAAGTAAEEEFGSVLSSWASSTKHNHDDSKHPAATTSSNRGITSDGRRPLAGFVLGGSHGRVVTRFPGPEVPMNYELKRHEFGPHEHPGAFRHESLLDGDFERMEQRRKKAALERKLQLETLERERQNRAKIDSTKPMAGTTFAGLAAAMKNRFTTSAAGTNDPSAGAGGTQSIGLQHPDAFQKSKDSTKKSVEEEEKKSPAPPREIKIVRTTTSFAPEALLCKRLGVVPPSNARFGGAKASVVAARGEAAFFQKDVLAPAVAQQQRQSTTREPAAKSRDTAADALPEDQQADNVPSEPMEVRPPMAVYKAVFEAESDLSSESEPEQASAVPAKYQSTQKEQDQVVDEPEVVATPPAPDDNAKRNTLPQETRQIPNGADLSTALVPREQSAGDNDDSSSSFEMRRDSSRKRRRHKKDRKRKRRRRSRSPSSSSGTESSSSDRRRRERRRKREERKRRKKKISSRPRKDHD